MSQKTPGKLLITGVHGQLGRALAAACQTRGCEFEGRDIDSLDITDPTVVDRWMIDAQPAAVINCAAYTAVDDCETNEAAALAVNGTAVGHLAAACNRVGATLVQISTDYVFSGEKIDPTARTTRSLQSTPTAAQSSGERSWRRWQITTSCCARPGCMAEVVAILSKPSAARLITARGP